MSNLLYNPIAEKYVKLALEEDIGAGDLTSNFIVDPSAKITVKLNSRVKGIFCGTDILQMVFKSLNPDIRIDLSVADGKTIEANQILAIIDGNARAILAGERTALNFIQRMSAIATLTNKYQAAIGHHKAKITDTRKTTPNFRIFEKYAVKVGGGIPHRFGLFDSILIKDNHKLVSSNINDNIRKLKDKISHTTKIEVEVENLIQVREAFNAGADIIMLDNMRTEDIRNAVEFIEGRAIIEASGNITLENISEVAATGVDFISTSAITANAGILDIGLDA